MSLPSMDSLSESAVIRVNEVCNEFEAAWIAGRPVRIESLLADDKGEQRAVLLVELILLEIELRTGGGEPVTLEDYAERFPEIDLDVLRQNGATVQSIHGQNGATSEPHEQPQRGDRLGDRYVLGDVLGTGGFGAVYKAWDEELQREVAVKVPVTSRRQVAHSELAVFLKEARTSAALDHPGIVPVYDVAGAGDRFGYVVSKLINGMELSTYAAQVRISGRS